MTPLILTLEMTIALKPLPSHHRISAVEKMNHAMGEKKMLTREKEELEEQVQVLSESLNDSMAKYNDSLNDGYPATDNTNTNTTASDQRHRQQPDSQHSLHRRLQNQHKHKRPTRDKDASNKEPSDIKEGTKSGGKASSSVGNPLDACMDRYHRQIVAKIQVTLSSQDKSSQHHNNGWPHCSLGPILTHHPNILLLTQYDNF